MGMNQQLIPWTVEIRELRTELRGASAGTMQAVSINVTVRALTPAVPAWLDECMDYQPICRWILDVLPTWQHGLRWESALRALLDFVFDADARIESVAAAIAAPGGSADALTIIRSRQEHEEAGLRRFGASMPKARMAANGRGRAAFPDASSQLDVVDGPVDAIPDV